MKTMKTPRGSARRARHALMDYSPRALAVVARGVGTRSMQAGLYRLAESLALS
jgi:hypothetical protein